MLLSFRSQSIERPTSAPWLDPKHKELVSYCTLLQEYSHQCYVKGKRRGNYPGGGGGGGIASSSFVTILGLAFIWEGQQKA